MKTQIMTVMMILMLAGCQASNDPAPLTNPGTADSALTEMAGWFHTLAKSRFNVGRVANVRHDDVVHATITQGDQGNYLQTDLGAAQALPNADAKALQRPPLTSDPMTHRGRVLTYFQTSGLALPQIDPSQMYETTTVDQITGPDGTVTTNLVRMYSHVPRYLDKNIPVADSAALASFNVDDAVTNEVAFWPRVSPDVVATARAMRTTLMDPIQGADYIQKVRNALANQGVKLDPSTMGTIVIHHTTQSSGKLSVGAYASYDVRIGTVMWRCLNDGSISPDHS